MLQNSPSWMLQGSCLSLWYDTLHEFGLEWTSNLGKTIISNMTSLTTSLSHRWIFWCHHIFLVGLVFSLYHFGSTLKEILTFDQKYRMKTVGILSVFYYGIVVKFRIIILIYVECCSILYHLHNLKMWKTPMEEC